MTEVAFGPNLGSVDMQRLFTESQEWTSSRTRISAFQFYVGHIIEPGSNFVHPNTFDKLVEACAFSNLKQWGILLELQMASGETLTHVQECHTKIAGAGGTLGAICFDHAFIETSAEAWAARYKDLKGWRPDLIVGAYAPFPYKSTRDIHHRVRAWEALGAIPNFLRMDIDYNLREEFTQRSFDAVRAICDEQSMALHMTVNGLEHHTDAEWVAQAKAWFTRAMRLGYWDAAMVQSWACTPSETERTLPHNLPESDPTSHTALLRWCLDKAGVE